MMQDKIRKIVGCLIRDNKLLVVRKKGKEVYTSLGGRPEPGETEEETLRREVKEEIGCEVTAITYLGTFEEKAVFDDAIVQLVAYVIDVKGTPRLVDDELEELRWVTAKEDANLADGLRKHIVPALVQKGFLR
jgi:8-oxo-dGTP pyrophosphatase MutT (NUDIX family)